MSTGPVNTWFYAVVQPPYPELFGEPAGVAGEPLRLLTASGIGAVVGAVPRHDFDEEALNAHLREAAWLERAVRVHHGVICALYRSHPLLPSRFATVCRDDAQAEALLTGHRAELERALDQVRGRTEWGVKAWCRPLPQAAAQSAAPAERPGAAYLERLRARRTEREDGERRATQQAERLHAQLVTFAADWAVHPLQASAATGCDDPMLSNNAYLVDDELADGFARAIDRLSAAAPDLRVELTGPWPPYSFAGGTTDTLTVTPTDSEEGP